jgi:dTDP-4-amino-4,6-dideoxygalactose transaminase
MLASNEKGPAKFFRVPAYVPDWGWPEAALAARSVISGQIVSGAATERLRSRIRSELGLRYVIPVNRARYAIQLGLAALGIGHGDDVVLPAYVCEAALEPIRNVGARPVFVEVDSTLHVTAETIEAGLTPSTKCVIVPHLFGNVAPIERIEKVLRARGVALIDDAAQSYGALCAGRPVGSFGNLGVIGCGPGKSLAGPAGGMLVTNDERIHQRASAIDLPPERTASVLRRVAAFWVWFRFRRFSLGAKQFSDRLLPRERKSGDRPGRMSNLDAMLALRQLDRWKANAERRRRVAADIVDRLGHFQHHVISDLSSSAVALRLAILLPDGGPTADDASKLLGEFGIEGRKGYEPLDATADRPGLPRTSSLARRVLLVPISKRLDDPRHRRAFAALEDLEVGGTRMTHAPVT